MGSGFINPNRATSFPGSLVLIDEEKRHLGNKVAIQEDKKVSTFFNDDNYRILSFSY